MPPPSPLSFLIKQNGTLVRTPKRTDTGTGSKLFPVEFFTAQKNQTKHKTALTRKGEGGREEEEVRR